MTDLTEKKDALTAKAFEAGSKLREVYDSVEQESQDYVKQVQEHIQQKPLQSGLIALGAGLLIGLFARRR